jgi:Rieske Fe-S protein
MADARVSRRNFVLGSIVTAGAGLAGYVVASNSSVAKAKSATTAANNYGYNAPPARQQIATVSQVPAGGALIVRDAGIVLVRNDAGEVHGYSATCTHQGCAVTDIRDGQIICPCHGSKFSIQSGAVTGGPARRPLPAIAVTVEGDAVFSGEGA